MDLNQIRYFLALARTLNFTRAAELCNVTQPALSRGIQRLEEELGGPLVLRERALTQLTELGRAMLPLLQQTFDAAEAVRERAEQRRRHEDVVPLRLGLAPFVPLAPLLDPLREVTSRIDGVALGLHRQDEAGLTESLLQGTLDVVLIPEPPSLPDRLNHWRLWPERLKLLLPEGHRLAGSAGVLNAAEAGSLAAEPLVVAAGTIGAAALERLRRAAGSADPVAPPARSVHSGSGPEEVAALVALGLGPALVPLRVPPAPGTVERALADPGIEVPVVLAAVAGRPMNRAVSAFVKLLRARRWEERQAA